ERALVLFHESLTKHWTRSDFTGFERTEARHNPLFQRYESSHLQFLAEDRPRGSGRMQSGTTCGFKPNGGTRIDLEIVPCQRRIEARNNQPRIARDHNPCRIPSSPATPRLGVPQARPPGGKSYRASIRFSCKAFCGANPD